MSTKIRKHYTGRELRAIDDKWLPRQTPSRPTTTLFPVTVIEEAQDLCPPSGERLGTFLQAALSR